MRIILVRGQNFASGGQIFVSGVKFLLVGVKILLLEVKFLLIWGQNSKFKKNKFFFKKVIFQI
jgi:hypothetical protein